MNISRTLKLAALAAGGIGLYNLGKLDGYDKGRKVGYAMGVVHMTLEAVKHAVDKDGDTKG